MSSAELAAQVEELRALGVRRVHSYAWRDLDDPEAGGSEVHADEILRRWAAAGLDIVHRTSTFDTPRTLQRNGYRIVQHGGRAGVLLRTPFEGVWRDRHTADAVIDIWNGLPWFSPLWFRGPRVTWLHHVHGKMWHEYFPRPIALAGHFTESRIAPRLYRHHPVVTLAESGREELVELGFRREGIDVIEPGLSAMRPWPRRAARSPTYGWRSWATGPTAVSSNRASPRSARANGAPCAAGSTTMRSSRPTSGRGCSRPRRSPRAGAW